MTPEVLERLTLTALEDAVAAAALAAAHTRGRCDAMLSDQVAVDAMRTSLNALVLDGARVVAGEGAKDQAPMLRVGEQFWPRPYLSHEGWEVGPNTAPFTIPPIQLVVDPLEATNCCARGEPGAICVAAAALDGEGSLLPVPECYQNKLVLGRDLRSHLLIARTGSGHAYPPIGALLDWDVKDLAAWVATHRGKAVRDVVAMVLDRPRNQEVIEALRSLDVQLKLIRDGDVTAALLALDPHHDVDFAIGIGGAVEGVLTAAMARCYGGHVEGRFWMPPGAGLLPEPLLDHVYDTFNLAQGHVIFALAAVTPNDLLPGVRFSRGGVSKVSVVSGSSRLDQISVREVTQHRKAVPGG